MPTQRELLEIVQAELADRKNEKYDLNLELANMFRKHDDWPEFTPAEEELCRSYYSYGEPGRAKIQTMKQLRQRCPRYSLYLVREIVEHNMKKLGLDL